MLMAVARERHVSSVLRLLSSMSSGSASDCFVSTDSEGSLGDSDSDDEFASCSSTTSDVMSAFLVSDPPEPLVGS
jgi:hypothetical protein